MAKDKAARDKEAEEEEERRLSNPYKRGEVLGPIAILCEPANSGKSWMRELVQNINKLGNVHQENFNCEVVDITKPRKNPDEPLPYGLVVSRVSDHGPEEVKQANLEWMIICDDQEISGRCTSSAKGLHSLMICRLPIVNDFMLRVIMNLYLFYRRTPPSHRARDVTRDGYPIKNLNRSRDILSRFRHTG